MEILERVIEQGLASSLLDENELEQLRDEVDQIDHDAIVRMVLDGIEIEMAGRQQRSAATVGWLRSRARGRPGSGSTARGGRQLE